MEMSILETGEMECLRDMENLNMVVTKKEKDMLDNMKLIRDR